MADALALTFAEPVYLNGLEANVRFADDSIEKMFLADTKRNDGTSW
jgi:hypothetical protein